MSEPLWLLVALLAGMAARLLHLPTLVGYLAAGFLVSTWGASDFPIIAHLGDLGVTLLLFTLGLHIRIKRIIRPEVIGPGIIHLLVSATLFTPVFLFLGYPLPFSLAVALTLGFSSTVLTAKSLEAREELESYHGRVAIGILILQDLVAIGLLATLAKETPRIEGLALLLLPFLRPVLHKILQSVGREEVLIFFGGGMALGIGVLFELVGLDSKLGALVAGILLGGTQRSEDLYQRLWSLREVFLVAFFLEVGLLGLPPLADGLLALGLLFVLPLKGMLFFYLMVRFRLRARTAFMGSLSLTAYSEFALIVAMFAAGEGWVEESFVAFMAVLVAGSFLVAAPLARRAESIWQRLDHRLTKIELACRHPDHQPDTIGVADYLVIGMGRAGTAAYDFLVEQGCRPTGLESDPTRIGKHREAGRRVAFGEAQDPELWMGISLEGIRGVLLALPNMETKIRAKRAMTESGYTGPVYALTRHDTDGKRLEEIGLVAVNPPMVEAGRELAQVALGEDQGS